jgi:heat shock protein HslJ
MARQRAILHALLATSILATVLTGSAAGQSPAASGTATAGALDGTSWSLGSITAAGTTTPIAGGAGATLDFVGDDAGGSTGCNHFSVAYTADGTSLTFSPVTTTRTPCDDAGMALESSYLSAFPTVATYAMTGEALTLMDATGSAVLTFGGAPMPTVEGTWVVTGFNHGSTTVTPSADTLLTVAFSPDGRAHGNGGCNDFVGPFGVSGTDISIGPLMSTTKSCGAALDAQEQQYITALQQGFTWTITSGTLELRDYDNTLWVRASSATGH